MVMWRDGGRETGREEEKAGKHWCSKEERKEGENKGGRESSRHECRETVVLEEGREKG